MEREQTESDKPVQVTKAVFNGLEFVRRSGATNMFDRPAVLYLAREFGFEETANWIEHVDNGTYARLIFAGPEVVPDDEVDDVDQADSFSEPDEYDVAIETEQLDATEYAWDNVRQTMNALIAMLGERVILTTSETYEVARMGVILAPNRHTSITGERAALIKNLGQASTLWTQLERTIDEVQRGTGSLQYMIDPENN